MYHSRLQICLIIAEFLVEDELAQTVTNADDVGQVVGKLFDRLNLLFQVVSFQEITKLQWNMKVLA